MHLCRELDFALLLCLLVCLLLLRDELKASHTRQALHHRALLPAWNSFAEAEIRFLNLNLISRPPAPYKLLCADARFSFLGHHNLAFLEATLFLVTGRHHYSLWQETRSWQDPHNNCPIGFIFLNSWANFQIIFSYRASVFCKRLRVREMRAASVLPRSAAEAPEVLSQHTLDRSRHPQGILELSQERKAILNVLEARRLGLPPSVCLRVWKSQGFLCTPGQGALRV